MIIPRLTAAVALTALTVSPALARHHHHHSYAPAVPPEAAAPTGYPWGNWQAEAIARATERQRAAPGLTEELAPDAKETATGGPSGGVPGFSGH